MNTYPIKPDRPWEEAEKLQRQKEEEEENLRRRELELQGLSEAKQKEFKRREEEERRKGLSAEAALKERLHTMEREVRAHMRRLE